MMKEDVNEKIKFFYENKIYSYIRLNSKTFFNGYIESIDENSITFKDDMLGSKPILKSDIDIIDYSMKKDSGPGGR